MIEPNGIPIAELNNVVSALDANVGQLSGLGSQFSDLGNNVHGTFQGLHGCYHAPEAELLIGSTQKIQKNLTEFGPSLPAMSRHLTNLASDVRGKLGQLKGIRTEAFEWQRKRDGNPEWRNDQMMIDWNNRMVGDVHRIMKEELPGLAFACANEIVKLQGGKTWDPKTGLREGQHAEKKGDQGDPPPEPWGTPEERDKPLWQDALEFPQNLLGGILTVVGETVEGLLTLVPVLPALASIRVVKDFAKKYLHYDMPSWSDAGNAWKGLGTLAVSVATSFDQFLWWGFDKITGLDTRPQFVKDLGEQGVEMLKGFVAWDEWAKNPGKAFGMALTNIVTTVGTFGAGAAIKGAAMAGKLGMASAAVAKIAKVADLAKAAKFAAHDAALGQLTKIPKVGSVVEGLSKIPIVGENFKMHAPKVDIPTAHAPDISTGTTHAPASHLPSAKVDAPTVHSSTVHTPEVHGLDSPGTHTPGVDSPSVPQHTSPGSHGDPATTPGAHGEPGTAPGSHPEPGTAPGSHPEPGTTPSWYAEPGTSPASRGEPGTSPASRGEPGTTPGTRPSEPQTASHPGPDKSLSNDWNTGRHQPGTPHQPTPVTTHTPGTHTPEPGTHPPEPGTHTPGTHTPEPGTHTPGTHTPEPTPTRPQEMAPAAKAADPAVAPVMPMHPGMPGHAGEPHTGTPRSGTPHSPETPNQPGRAEGAPGGVRRGTEPQAPRGRGESSDPVNPRRRGDYNDPETPDYRDPTGTTDRAQSHADSTPPWHDRANDPTRPPWHDPDYDPTRPSAHDPNTPDPTHSPEHEFGPEGSQPRPAHERPPAAHDPNGPHDGGNDPKYDDPLTRQVEIDQMKPDYLRPEPGKVRSEVDPFNHIKPDPRDPRGGELVAGVGEAPVKNLFNWVHKVNPDNGTTMHYGMNCPDVSRAVSEVLNGEKPRLAAGNKFKAGEHPDTTLEWMGLKEVRPQDTFHRPPGRPDDWSLDQQAFQKVRDALQGRPPGTHANVGVNWVGGGGHRFNAFVDADGSVKWLDAQPSGAARKLPEGSRAQREAIERDMVKDGNTLPYPTHVDHLDFSFREPGGEWSGIPRTPDVPPASQRQYMPPGAHGSG
ncbi:MAG TPA: toxin glutamine deamidase domain-containing protein, partial [Kribbella sp.]